MAYEKLSQLLLLLWRKAFAQELKQRIISLLDIFNSIRSGIGGFKHTLPFLFELLQKFGIIDLHKFDNGLIDEGDILIGDSFEMANIFRSQFEVLIMIDGKFEEWPQFSIDLVDFEWNPQVFEDVWQYIFIIVLQ